MIYSSVCVYETSGNPAAVAIVNRLVRVDFHGAAADGHYYGRLKVREK